MATNNPRAVIGGNDAPDFAKLEVDRLQQDYGELYITVDKLVAEADTIPAEITDDATKDVVTGLIKRIRDAKVRIEGLHDLEKQPHLRRGQGVDQYFFGLWDRLVKRSKANRDGASDILQRKLTIYDSKKLAEEQERRRREAEAAAEEARKKEAARIAAEKEAAEKLAEAERARNPVKIEEKTQVARAAVETVIEATGEAAVAKTRADEAYISTLSRPADIMRTRSSDGTLSTMGTEKYAEVTDRQELLKSAAKLWPYIPNDALEKAVRAYANSFGYSEDASVQIDGARFGKRAKSVVR